MLDCRHNLIYIYIYIIIIISMELKAVLGPYELFTDRNKRRFIMTIKETGIPCMWWISHT